MILDTNAYTALLKDKYGVVSVVQTARDIVLPIPVVAELRFGFVRGSQQIRNEQKLQLFLLQSNTRTINISETTTHIYAELAALCRSKGRVLSNNDVWIAALAIEHDRPLVTYDKDFITLADRLGGNLLLLKD
ncbi:MAG: PIN domain-containing protein [Candidatus Saccharimonadales bacterium]